LERFSKKNIALPSPTPFTFYWKMLTRKYLEWAEREVAQFFKFTIHPPPNQISLGTFWQ
jgi:hypothetical protein